MSDETNKSIQTESEAQAADIRYIPIEYLKSPHSKDNEYNVLDLLKVVWEGRKLILYIVLAFTFLGLFNFIFGPEEYESDSILMQEIQGQGSQANQLLQRIGGNLGISTSNIGEDIIPPDLYPQIVYSAEFQREVLHEVIEFEDVESMSILEYFSTVYTPPINKQVFKFIRDYTIGLPFTIYGLIQKKTANFKQSSSSHIESEKLFDEEGKFLLLTKDEREQINNLRSRIELEIQSGLITVRSRMPDAMASAVLNQIIVEKIQDYVTNYRIQKARQNLAFVEVQHREAKERYDHAQKELAEFQDQNQSIQSAVARIQQEELQNRRNLQFNVYNSISQQVEQSRLKVQEETPVFNILQRSRVPLSSVSSSVLVLVSTIFIGAIIAVFFLLIKSTLISIKEYIEK